MARRPCGKRMSASRKTVESLARSQRNCHLAVLAEAWLLPRQPGLGELERGPRGARRSIPQFGGQRLDLQKAHIWIARSARAPHPVPLFPNFLDLGGARHTACAV